MGDSTTILHDTIVNGTDENVLKILHEPTVDLKSTDDDGNTLLHLAFKNVELTETQLIDIMQMFLDRGIDIATENKLGKTILHLAIEYRMRDVIDFCLENTPYSDTTAHFAIEEECRKLHSFIDDDTIDNHKPLERESANFIDWMASRNIDFFYAKRKFYTAFHLSIALNLRHLVLALLKYVKVDSPVDTGSMHLIIKFVTSSAAPDQYITINTSCYKPIPPSHYGNRYSQAIVKVILEKNRFIDDLTLTRTLTMAISFDHDKAVIQMLLGRLNRVVSTGKGGLIHTFAMKFHDLTNQSAVQAGLSTLRTLIKKGANEDERDYNGNTHAQAMFRAHPSLRLLEVLKRTTDFSTRADNGQNFLHIIAELTDEPKMVDLVQKRCGISLEERDDDGMTPLKMALFRGHDLVATKFVELGAKFEDDIDGAGRTLLTIACQFGNPGAVETLVQRGADLKWRNKDGMSLLHMTRENSKVVELLLKYGLDVNAKGKEGKTPMHGAMTGPVVRTLFESGARVDTLDDRGDSPLMFTMNCWRSEVVAELLRCGADMREPKALDVALRLCRNWTDIKELRYFRRHLMKLKAAGLLVEEDERLAGKYFEECQDEVDKLKTFLIDDGTSLYKLLHKSPNRRSSYASNEKLKSFVGDKEMELEFPNYFVLIAGCYNHAVTREPLMRNGVRALNEFAGVVWPDLCADKVIGWLVDEDLRRLGEALENGNLKV